MKIVEEALKAKQILSSLLSDPQEIDILLRRMSNNSLLPSLSLASRHITFFK
jgi:hypothetical protein